MPSCLGIYVEENLIKYAKVSKDHENTKVESFGIKFYDNFDETIKQIVSETYSFKTPISINISDEQYTSSNLFNLLNKQYFTKAINTEFEIFCNDTGKNKNLTEMRYLQTQNTEDKDKTTILYSYCNKSSIASKTQMVGNYRLGGIYPLPIAIANLSKFQEVSNTAIINIEDKTTVTTIVNGKVNKVNQIDLGMREILNSINVRENSYQKSYEICKNSTIYTLGSQNLQTEENDYMDNIMPTLFSIVEKVKEIFETNQIHINNLYLTGLATAINNIDLYFQENFDGMNCEILSPYFANKANLKLNVRDYIEVNSAIALALQELNDDIKGINFKKKNGLQELTKILSADVGKPKQPKTAKTPSTNKKISFNLGGALDIIDKNLLRTAIGFLILLVVYIIGEKILIGAMNNKQSQIQDVISDTNDKIKVVTDYTKNVNSKTTQYETLIQSIDEANQKITESYASKNAIPNFLTQLMFNMPVNVQIVSIQNTSGKSMKIVAQAEKYEQLGYLKAALKNAGILTEITSTSGTKQNGVVEVTITGKLPY